MKKFLAKLNELEKMLLLATCVALVLAGLSLLPLFLAHQPGWLIGVGIGSVIEIANIFLLYKGSEIAMKTLKSAIFLLLYFSRMALFLVGLLLVAMFQFGFLAYVQPLWAFKNAIWGVLIGYTPMQIIVIIVMVRSKKSFITISENLHEEEKE